MTKHRPHSLGVRCSLNELSFLGAARTLDPLVHTPEGSREWNTTPLLWRREVPLCMPWWSAERGAVTFTGAVMPSSTESDLPGMMKIKRRNEREGEGPSRKHFLSEEAMAARFTCLSLTNDHVYSSNGFPLAKGKDASGISFQDEESRFVLGGEEEWSTESSDRKDVIVEGMFDMSDSRVIVVSPELQRRLQRPPDDILPQEVLQSMSHPCMELVLWQSPGNLIQRAIRALSLQTEGKETEDETGGGQRLTEASQQGDQMEL
ncbi:uncharacterized protein LOC121273085 isoform X2 [Carcharodon carcharias]|uniref:uncharacterized protein LOC121273085 isoform X2 n=1 Tax=Carcharodon carcharias TaxID=13397 RepID=UPI001B7EBEAD|nr:uncharacterized protein LOC121273085 isoform X2 [Carcharodon carcharias]